MNLLSLQRALASVATAGLLFGVGCNRLDPPYALEPAKSCDKLEREIKLQAQTQIRMNYGWVGGLPFIGRNGGGWLGGSGGMEDAALGAAAPSTRGKNSVAPRLHSDTNVQVEGVDEADLVETDGTYLYALAGDHLIITEAWPAAAAHEVGRVEVEGQAQGIFLRESEGRIAVISQTGWVAPKPLAGGSRQLAQADQSMITKVTLIDVSDPAAPQVERETYLEGTFHDSRLVDDHLFVITYVDLYFDDLFLADTQADAMRLSKKSTLADWMPRRADNVRSGSAWTSTESDICGCQDVNLSVRQSGTHLLTISSFDVTNPAAAVEATSVLGSVQQVYANGRSLYILSEEEAEGPWRTFDAERDTIIHRFDIPTDGAKPVYDVSGKVPGTLSSGGPAMQFSIDEYQGRLRVVTNRSDADWNSSVGLYILEPRATDLHLVGLVDPVVEDEDVYAVRFVDTKAYVVTFRQIDPLFIIDLTNAKRPEVRGALEIPGFSNYLHPIDENHLLGIGTNGGWGGDVQVSLFDVSDDTDPVMDSRLTLADSGWSEAQNDHHAFNFFAPHDALFVPVQSARTNASEVRVINAKVGEPLAELGSVSNTALRAAAGFTDGQYDWCVDQRRSVVIESALYAVSGAGITVTSVRDPAQVLATVPFGGIDPCADITYYQGGVDEGW